MKQSKYLSELKLRVFYEEVTTKHRLLNPIIKAMRNWQVIEFFYQSSGTNNYTLTAPLCLKEFEGHWYLLGSDRNNEVSIYALDKFNGVSEYWATFSLPQNIDWSKFVKDFFDVKHVL